MTLTQLAIAVGAIGSSLSQFAPSAVPIIAKEAVRDLEAFVAELRAQGVAPDAPLVIREPASPKTISKSSKEE